MQASRRRVSLRPAFALLPLAASLMLAGCGGGGDSAPAAAAQGGDSSAPTASKLSGTVAVGAPITNGTLRILDATGAVVASDVAIDADGHYADLTLTGPAPYRIEACGYAGSNYLCVYSVANGAGTANVTPLTTATMALATGQTPGALMNGDASTLTSTNLDAAQNQLRTSLTPVLTSAGVSGTVDFVTAPLEAGSRTGYDGVLDAIGVNLGQDGGAFVQITPRIGTGNLYLQQNSSSGAITSTASAASLQLSGLETLFRNISAAMASPEACSNSATGIRRSLATNASMNVGGGQRLQGADQVAEGICMFFSGAASDDGQPLWGARLISPTLGRCDLSGSAPVCGVSFVLQSPQGDVMPVGQGMGVTQEGGAWKLLGDLLPIDIYATAKAQRTVYLSGSGPSVDYDRAIAFEVGAVNGLSCARISQKDANGNDTPIAYYKAHSGATRQYSLSLWTTDGMGNQASLDPSSGSTRSADDTWYTLPRGAEGDSVIRNFYRGGRSVTVSLYSDMACSTPFAIGGRSQFEVEITGVPPVYAAMQSLPWPELDSTTRSNLLSFSMGASATGSFHAAWSFPQGPSGLNGVTLCSSRDDCGRGGAGRLGDANTRPSAVDATINLYNSGSAVAAGDAKTLAIYTRTGEGVDLESNFMTCSPFTDSQSCH
jgi:hypothetical protein